MVAVTIAMWYWQFSCIWYYCIAGDTAPVSDTHTWCSGLQDNASEGGMSEGASVLDEAAAGEGTDYRRGQRVRKLVKLMTSKQVRHHSQTFLGRTISI